MIKRTHYIALLIAAVIIAATSLYFHEGRIDSSGYRSSVSDLDPNQVPYILSKTQIGELKKTAENGDCTSSLLLAKYYLYGALELDTGISWLRLAARCPNVDVKVYFAMTLLDHANYVEVSQELEGLLPEIRQLDPSRAAEIERKMASRKNGL